MRATIILGLVILILNLGVGEAGDEYLANQPGQQDMDDGLGPLGKFLEKHPGWRVMMEYDGPWHYTSPNYCPGCPWFHEQPAKR